MTNQDKKILGIDFGTKTIGLAIHVCGVTMPYKNIENNAKTFKELAQIIEDEWIKLVVLGLPLNASGTESDRTRLVKSFYEELKQHIDIDIILCDERYSTKQCVDILKKDSYKASQIKKVKDMNAACIIIDSYLEKGK